MDYINVEEFWSYLDGKIVDATTVFNAIEQCSKHKITYVCANCGATIKRPICDECKVGILNEIYNKG